MSRYRKPETYYFLRHEVTNCEIKPTYLEGASVEEPKKQYCIVGNTENCGNTKTFPCPH